MQKVVEKVVEYRVLTRCQHCGVGEFEPVTGLCKPCLVVFMAEVSGQTGASGHDAKTE